MKREHNWTGSGGSYTLTIEGSAVVIPVMGMSELSVEVPSAKTIAVYASCQEDANEDTTFRIAYDTAGSAIVITCTAAGVWACPKPITPFAKLKLVLNGGGAVHVFTIA